MSQSSPARPAINLALIGLWVVTAVVLAVGIWLLLSSNGRQVELYTGQSDDYAAYLSAQGGTTLGGLLIGVGALGLLLSLATQAVISAAAHRNAAVPAAYHFVDTDEYGDDFADESVEVPARADATAAVPAASAAPVVTEAPVAEAPASEPVAAPAVDGEPDEKSAPSK
ncbi:hypothetical protein [Agromyces ramosus]|uniref:Uncharacterized protein n=1 Tax=Agromyces ramosus TaxID=33879 RepID=A0ABU0R7S7_9MICO|nr:hypothetical protein [Agromyces ramosus]MDQ0894124.1 hypothetical protein [Agromyces ramosus]